MRPKLVLLASYFIVTPVFLFALIFYQLFLLHQNSEVSAKAFTTNMESIEYRALPESVEETTVIIDVHESRVDALKTFLGRYSSPLLSYAEDFVDAADRYGIDYRLLPAIAMQESTLCLKAPKGSNNCWGFGIYGKKVTKFSDLGEAIEAVSKTMAQDYHANGLVEPDEIMSKYAPSNNGEWAQNVSYVMDRIAASL